MTNATTFIYALVEADTREPRYVGKASDPKKRFSQHIYEASVNRHDIPKDRWIRKRLKQSNLPEMVVIVEVPYKEWKKWERRFITQFRKSFPRILNATDGGDGLTNPSQETRLKQRVAKLGKVQPSEQVVKKNMALRGQKRKNSSSAYVGVFWNKLLKKWLARVYYKYVSYHVGVFECEEAAAKAYNKAAIELLGSNTKLNTFL